MIFIYFYFLYRIYLIFHSFGCYGCFIFAFFLFYLSLSHFLVLHANSTFNFTVGELSWLAVVLLLLACLVLHYIPIRVLLLLWGFVKFSRRLLRPHSVPNNEVLDLLSRVPDDDQLVNVKRKLCISIPKIRRVHQMKNIRLSFICVILCAVVISCESQLST